MMNTLFHWQSFLTQIQKHLKYWTRPVLLSLLSGGLSDLAHNRSDLIMENALLHQQLINLKRQMKKPSLTSYERFLLVLLARCTRFWKQALHIIQPDTLLRWHRDWFRWYWRWNSKR